MIFFFFVGRHHQVTRFWTQIPVKLMTSPSASAEALPATKLDVWHVGIVTVSTLHVHRRGCLPIGLISSALRRLYETD